MKHKLTPTQYIRTRARTLPIEACYINSGWEKTGMASILVARKHSNGNLTMGVYLVDLYALGTKDSFYSFNEGPEKLEQMLETQVFEKCEYVLAHNIIYGANEFAEEHGFRVCREFGLTQYILEEDDDKIPLMELEFGKDGVPFLII
jgi:hypothetical protein